MKCTNVDEIECIKTQPGKTGKSKNSLFFVELVI